METQRIRVAYNVPLILADMAEKGWMDTHLARAAGVSAMTVGRFLKGHVQTATTAKKLSKALGRSVKRYIVHPIQAVAS